MEAELCKEHSGIRERLKDCEDNLKALWSKFDSVQKMALGIFVTLTLNLVVVIFILLRG